MAILAAGVAAAAVAGPGAQRLQRHRSRRRRRRLGPGHARERRRPSDYPSLTSFDGDDNLQVTLDFRSVYASLLEGWMGTGADEVIPNSKAFRRLGLVR